jgi:hypothetical protein
MATSKWFGFAVCLLLLTASLPASAGLLYSSVKSTASGYGLQPRPANISVCFYGNATTVRAARVAQIQAAFTGNTMAAANVVFTGFGACRAPSKSTCGADKHSCDYYWDDIRIALDGTTANGSAVGRQIPASFTDCDDHGYPSSWAMFPDAIDTAGKRACPYNAAVGDDSDTSQTPPVPWLNHPLHEVGGHALGFAHEFLQAGYYNYVGPNGSICSNSTGTPDGASNPSNYVPLTPVDPYSVMMYQVTGCGIDGNYGFGGYSGWDRLSMHIMYPENYRAIEFFGGTVTTVGVPVHITQMWIAQGANSSVIKSPSWSIGGVTSNQASFNGSWNSTGSRTGTLTYQDFLGRTFQGSIEVRVYQDNATLAGAVIVPSASALVML